MHIACENSRLPIVHLLLSNHCNVNAQNKLKETPLHVAARVGNVKIVEMLLDYHINSRFFKNVKSFGNEINLNIQDSDGMTPLMRAFQREPNQDGSTEIIKLLVSNDCDVNQVDNLGNTALFYAL